MAEVDDAYYQRHREGILAKKRALYHARREVWLSRSRAYNEKNRVKLNDKARQYRVNNAGRVRDSNLRAKFGVTLQQYEDMYEAQQGTCAICSKEETSSNQYGVQRLSVDHDRSCCAGEKSCGGCVRALLCNSCNNGLGRFADNPKLLRNAALYVESFSKV